MSRLLRIPRTLRVAAAAAAIACSHEDAPRVPVGNAVDRARAEGQAHALIGPAARAALDSGNALFRRREYDGALAQYRAAATLAPQHAAPLFGIYMVARATKNSVMADSALAQIRLRSGPMPDGPHTLSDSGFRRMHDSLRRRTPAS